MENKYLKQNFEVINSAIFKLFCKCFFKYFSPCMYINIYDKFIYREK